jgi:hypothetical protein
MSWKGTWDNSTPYIYQDVVYYIGETYVATQDVPEGINPTNATYWQKVAKKGDDGAEGTDGTDGTDGARGPEGPEGPQGPLPPKATTDDVDEGTNNTKFMTPFLVKRAVDQFALANWTQTRIKSPGDNVQLVERDVVLGRSYRYRGWDLSRDSTGTDDRSFLFYFLHPGADSGNSTLVMDVADIQNIGYFNFDIYIPHLGESSRVYLSCVSDIPDFTDGRETVGWSKQGWLDPIDVPVSDITKIEFNVNNTSLNVGAIDEFEYFED